MRVLAPSFPSDLGPAAATSRSPTHSQSAPPLGERARREAARGAPRHVGRSHLEQALRVASPPPHRFAREEPMNAQRRPQAWRLGTHRARPQPSPEPRLQRWTRQDSSVGLRLSHPRELERRSANCGTPEPRRRETIARPSPSQNVRKTQATLAAQRIRSPVPCQPGPPPALPRRAVSRVPPLRIAHRHPSGERPGTCVTLRAMRVVWRLYSPAPHR